MFEEIFKNAAIALAIMYISVVVSLFVSAFFSLYKQLQMLQQNSYYPSRYYKWLKENYAPQVALLAIVFCVLSSLNTLFLPLVFSLAISIALLIIRIVLFIRCRKTSIKKLVFTKRIKRLYVFAAVIAVLLIVLFVFGKELLSQIAFMFCVMFAVMTPLFVLFLWLITKPVESIISKHYINDAKKILKSNENLTVIGVTGSFGKTTTKFILNRILSERFNTVCTPQSFNTPMGVVRTVRGDIKPNTQIFICEMGAKNKGDIREICDIAHPKYGIITSVGAQHLDTFGSIDNVFKTKFELADEVRKNGGFTFISGDSEDIVSRYDKNDKSLVLFGGNGNYRVENIKRNAFGSNFDLCLEDTRIPVSTKLLGLHSIYDILAAASLAFKLGATENDIKVAVSSLKATEHRLELKSFAGGLLIDDAYNSNPVGCLEAVRTLGTFDGYKKAIITPGLIELGDKEYEANYNLGIEAAKYCDIIILVGINRSKPMMDAINTTDFNKNKVYVVSSFKEAMEVYTPMANKNSVVLLENDLPDNYLN